MVIDNEKIACLLEKCADYIEATENDKSAQQEQQQVVVKQASERKEKASQERAESAKEVLSAVLNKEISDKEAQKFAQSDIGIELLNKISTSPADELGEVEDNSRSREGKKAHWNVFANQVMETS